MQEEFFKDAENYTGVFVWTDCRHRDPPLSEWLQPSSGPVQPPASGWWPPAPSQPWPPYQWSGFDPGSDDVNVTKLVLFHKFKEKLLYIKRVITLIIIITLVNRQKKVNRTVSQDGSCLFREKLKFQI
jgi:hypothetical protein